MSSNILSVFLPALLLTLAAAGIGALMRPLLLVQKARVKLKNQIRKKIQSGIQLQAPEISDIGRGLGLSATQSIKTLFELYSEAEGHEEHAQFKILLSEINREEPFESFPEEVRPSLARLSTLCTESPVESDKELLHPLKKVLGEYQEMKSDHATIKKQSHISYVVALISFFIGAVGIILAFTGPSKEFISGEVQKSTNLIRQQINSTQHEHVEDAHKTARR